MRATREKSHDKNNLMVKMQRKDVHSILLAICQASLWILRFFLTLQPLSYNFCIRNEELHSLLSQFCKPLVCSIPSLIR